MASRTEDYALIGDCETAALVARSGSIDWLCLPRFDSPACFAALLGTPEHGRWHLGPAAAAAPGRRRYRDGTLVLETEHETAEGAVVVTEAMLPRADHPTMVRLVEGRRGAVAMRMELVIRFDYGSLVPCVRRVGDDLLAVGGPNALRLTTPAPLRGVGLRTVCDFTVMAGQRVPFVLTWFPSHRPAPPRVDAADGIRRATEWWRQWSARCQYDG